VVGFARKEVVSREVASIRWFRPMRPITWRSIE
jgi:hypothetical protein